MLVYLSFHLISWLTLFFVQTFIKLDVCWVGRPISSVGANIFRANFTCMLFDVDAVISSFI